MAESKYVGGVTKSGFAFNIKKERLDNIELIDALAELETDPLQISNVITLILGDEKKKLYDHVRTEEGFVPTEKVEKELSEIFELSQEIKN